jgi:hypothetical protein
MPRGLKITKFGEVLHKVVRGSQSIHQGCQNLLYRRCTKAVCPPYAGVVSKESIHLVMPADTWLGL